MTTAVAPRATFTPPAIELLPEIHSSALDEALDIASLAGLELDGWQQHVLYALLGEQVDGRWAAFEAGLNVPRQNGKGTILEVRELAGLFLPGDDRLIVHSAHEFATSREHQLRLETLIQNTPELNRRVRAYKHAHGEEGIYLKDGRRLLFRTRTKGGGRGFSGDLIVLDEAMMLAESAIAALFFTLRARSNPQVIYAGSAVDQEEHPNGVVFARLRERALAGDDDALAYFEWSISGPGGPQSPSEVTPEMVADPDSWRRSNPALGTRIDPEHVAKEAGSVAHRTFCVESLGVGDWPDTAPDAGSVFNFETWKARCDPGSQPGGRVCIAFDTSPERTWTSIAAAGIRSDGRVHVEIVDRRPGTGWLDARIPELRSRHDPAWVGCDGKSPASTKAAALNAETLSTDEYVRACGDLFDLIEEDRLRYSSAPELAVALDNAVRGAATRSLGDAWAWSRRSAKADITPLVAATVAVAKATEHLESVYETRDLASI